MPKIFDTGQHGKGDLLSLLSLSDATNATYLSGQHKHAYLNNYPEGYRTLSYFTMTPIASVYYNTKNPQHTLHRVESN